MPAEADQIIGEDRREVLALLTAGLLLPSGVLVLSHVVPQVGRLAEASLADLALEGPRPGVDVHVTLQVPRGGK